MTNEGDHLLVACDLDEAAESGDDQELRRWNTLIGPGEDESAGHSDNGCYPPADSEVSNGDIIAFGDGERRRRENRGTAQARPFGVSPDIQHAVCDNRALRWDAELQ